MSTYGVDIEVFPNFHSMVAINLQTKERHIFVLHPDSGIDDRIKYLAFLKQEQVWITFNGIHYDYPVVHRILTNKSYISSKPLTEVVKKIYQWSCDTIAGNNVVWESEALIRQHDLFKIYHFDNKARSASLKHLEFYMRWHDLRDMPLDPSKPVPKDKVNDIIQYNINDVEATLEFYKLAEKENRIQLRRDVYNSYGLDVTNKSDVSIGSELLLKFLSEDMNISKQDLKQMRTIRRKIPLKDCIPQGLRFHHSEFQKVYDFLNSQVIKNTKNVFDNLTFVLNEVEYKYGTGGLHACAPSGIYKSDETYVIKDVDVSSYYPNIAVNYNYRPAHLGETFSSRYKWMYEERQKIPKSDPRNGVFKLSLNGSINTKR